MAKKTTERVIAVDTKGAENSIAALRVKIRELTDAQRALDVESAEFRDISTELTSAQTRLRNAMQGNTAAVEGSYKAYSHQLQVLKEHRKWLAEGTEEYRKATEEISKLDQKLKDMDAEIGVFGRNVGNYRSAFDGLNMSVAQVTRELPSLTMGANQFFLAISNNIPMLFDEIKAYKSLANEGKTNVGVLGALSKALVSWNTLITIGITLLSQYGGKIVDWVSGLFKAERELSGAAQAQRDFNDAMGDAFDGLGDDILKIRELKDAWASLGDDMNAKEVFIRKNQSAMEELGLSIANAAEAELFFTDHSEEFIEAMKLRAKAAAASKLATEKYEKILYAEDELTRIPKTKKQAEWVNDSSSIGGGYYYDRTVDNPEYKAAEDRLAKAYAYIEYLYTTKNKLEEEAAAILKGIPAATPKVTPTVSMSWNIGNAYGGNKKLGIPGIAGNAVNQGAAIESARVRAAAMSSIAEASAEEHKAIEQQLVEDLVFIEQMRLETHEMLINEMLRSDEITADERLTLEEELSKNLEAQAELRAEAAERAADRGAKAAQKQAEAEKKAAKEAEDAEKKKQRCKEQILNNTASLLKSAADMAKENSAEQKMLNAASVVIDTISASVKAWKSGFEMGGLPMAIFNTAATVAMGGAQLKALMAVNPDGSNAEAALSSAQVPNVASTMPASYTRNLMGNNELSELNKDIRVYVVEQDITDAQNASKARVESASF